MRSPLAAAAPSAGLPEDHAAPSHRIDHAIVDDILADGGAEEGLLDLFLEQSRVRLQNLEQAVGEPTTGGAWARSPTASTAAARRSARPRWRTLPDVCATPAQARAPRS